MKQQTKEATIKAILRESHSNKLGEHPVKIRVTHNRIVKFYKVTHEGKPIYMLPGEFKIINDRNQKVKGKRKEKREVIDYALSAAKQAADKIRANGYPFSFDRFENEYLIQDSKEGFLALFKSHLNSLSSEGRVGTYRTYNSAYNSFKRYRKDKDLAPIDITPSLLKGYEKFVKDNGGNKTTIGIYMRSIKVIYNLAVDEYPYLKEHYPFTQKQTDRKGYKIKTGSGKKGEALTSEQLQAFKAMEVEPGTMAWEDKLLWLFSFYCQGMNFRDLSLLKYKNIQGDAISYVRQKTRDTEAKEELIEIPLTDPLREIIVSIGNTDKKPNSYVFNIIDRGMSFNHYKRRITREKTKEERIDEIIRQRIKTVNENVKGLCANNNLPPVTTYWARHTYANLLKQGGIPMEMIRELLGHADIRTTENYVKRFGIEQKRAINEQIQAILKVS